MNDIVTGRHILPHCLKLFKLTKRFAGCLRSGFKYQAKRLAFASQDTSLNQKYWTTLFQINGLVTRLSRSQDLTQCDFFL